MRPVCLHVNNYCWCGGIGTFCRDFALTFPEFDHEIIFLNDETAQPRYLAWLRESGIKCSFHPFINEVILAEVNPDVLCIHNAKPEDYKAPEDCFQKRVVINFHHAMTSIFPHTNLDVFVSRYVRDNFYGREGKMKQWKIVNPACWRHPFAGIQTRELKNGELPVIGRIQSGTFQRRGKWNGFNEILAGIKGATFLTVGSNEANPDERFKTAPIRPGAMGKYLQEIDIFAIDCPTLETWSRVCTEAMLAGKPVLAVNYGDGLSEQLTKANAPLYRDKGRFAQALQAFVDSPALRLEVGERLRKWALANCTEANLRQNLASELFGLVTNACITSL